MALFGFSKCDITPEIGCFLYGYVDDLRSERIHDRLNVNAFYFEDETTSAFLISAEVCSINTEFSEKMRKALSENTGVPYENIMLHGIHNHTGPNTDGNTGWGALDIPYCENILLPAALTAAKAAVSSAVPAKVGVGMGESYIGVNRREQDIYNNIIFGQCEWGSFDPRMSVFSFRNAENNSVIANLIFYTCHGTTAGLCNEISRDWAGGMIDTLEAHTNAPTAFFCGAEGDAGPRLSNGQTVGTIRDTEIMGETAGKDAVRIFDSIVSYSPLTFSVTSGVLKLPLKNRISKEDAASLLERFRNNTVNLEGQKKDYAVRVLKSYEDGYQDKEFLSVPQTAISIGSFIFVAFPYELFSDIALRINKAKKGFEVFSLSNTNGSAGYFPCHSEISKGGYEIDMFLTHNIQPYCDNADFSLIKETLYNLEVFKCIE